MFWRSLKSWSRYMGKVFLTDISDMVALCEKLKSLDPNYFWVIFGQKLPKMHILKSERTLLKPKLKIQNGPKNKK